MNTPIFLKGRTGILLFSLFCCALNSIAQNQRMDKIDRIIPPDPESGNLGRYGNYNFNLATGQVDISIPIYEVKGSTINYPLSLSYDHQGMRPEERATSAGLNWNFQAAGVITKTVIGDDDDKPGVGYNDRYGDIATLQSSSADYTPANTNDAMFKAASGTIDLQPDIFSFSFGNRSGKFFYDPASDSYYTMPYSALSIKTKPIPGGGGYYFVVTDEQGYQYLFERVLKTTIFSDGTYGTASSSNYQSQWYLTLILTPDDNVEMTFEYIDDNMINDPTIISRSKQYLAPSVGCPLCPGSSQTLIFESNVLYYTEVLAASLLISKIKSPFEDVEIAYASRTDESQRIDEIKVKKKDNTELQKWKFYHSYYTGGNKLRLDSLALFSDQAKIKGYIFGYNGTSCPSKTVGRDAWGFAGNGTDQSFPRIWYTDQYIGDVSQSASYQRTSDGILTSITNPTGGRTEFDFELNDYGHITHGNIDINEPVYSSQSTHLTRRTQVSGIGTSTATFQIQEAQVVTFNSSRDNCDCVWPSNGTQCIDPSEVSIWLTGPSTNINLNGAQQQQSYNFYYNLQPGTYTLHVQTNANKDCGKVTAHYDNVTGYTKKETSGGLRIKQLRSYDLLGGIDKRTFTYIDKDDAARSSGHAALRPRYIYNTTSVIPCNVTLPPAPPTYCESIKNTVNFSQESNYSLYYSNESPVCYERVVETIGENGAGGYIDHRFSKPLENFGSTFPFITATPAFWKYGKLLSKYYFSNTNELKKEEINQYTFDLQNNYHEIKGLKAGFKSHGLTSPLQIVINWDINSYISQWCYLNKTTIKTYPDDGSPPVVVEKSYFYDNTAHIQPSRISTVNSNAVTNIVRSKFAADYVSPGASGDIMVNALSEMLTKNMIAVPIEQTESVIRNGQEYITRSNLGVFKEFTTGKVYPWEGYQLEISNPISFLSLSSVSANSFIKDSRFKKRIEYTAYNAKGKLMQANDETNRNFSIKYGYNDVLPVIYAKNAAANQVYYEGFEEMTSGTSTTSKYGQKGFNGPFTINGVLLTTGSYQLSYWQWDGASWQYITQSINHNGSSPISINVNYVIDEVCIRPISSDVSTVNYDPSLGVTGKTADNGGGLKFDFDNTGRLIRIRDHKNNILKQYSYQFQGAQ